MTHSQNLFARAQHYLPGGVNSPVRAFHGVQGEPIFIKKGSGAYLTDVDDQTYIDYVGSFGPLILGHAHPYVVDCVIKTLQDGFGFGAPTLIEIRLAEKINELMPSLEMMRFVSSGTEACMSAIRLARGFTKRDKILKFSGCYHGHADSLLVSAGSGALTLGVPNSAGIPDSVAQHTLVAEYNHLKEVSALFAKYGDSIAAIIVEPVAGNMNCVLPLPGFLQGLRELCDKYGSILIFDEVMTGFRVALGGAQHLFDVRPDLTVLGKIVGGGFPVGAFGGRAEIMKAIAPLGPVYQAGTLSGNPVAMSAGLATLDIISQPGFYESLSNQTQKLMQGLAAHAQLFSIPLKTISVGGMFGLFFTSQSEVNSEGQVRQCDISLFTKFFHSMLKQGIYFAPSAFEAGFVSSAHEDNEIAQTLTAAKNTFNELK